MTKIRFVKYPELATGKNFIGRKNILDDIEKNFFADTVSKDDLTNMAFIGVNCIGTSSMINHAIFQRSDHLILEKKIVPIWISRINYGKQPSEFFKGLVDKCNEKMRDILSREQYSIFQTKVNDALEALKPSDPWTPWETIGRVFVAVRNRDYHVLLILDGFDRTREIFEGDVAFDFLRELISRETYGVKLILTSRLGIDKIQEQAGSTSLFAGVFNTPVRLAMFDEEDMTNYFLLFSSISDEAKERLIFYCGHHPYLLQMLGYQIARANSTRATCCIMHVEQAAIKLSGSIAKYYDILVSLLKEIHLLEPLLRILINGESSVAKEHVNELSEYGLIKQSEGTYVAFSNHFHEYLNENFNKFQSEMQREQLGDALFNIWRNTEKKLRKIIHQVMSSRVEFGENWIDSEHSAIKKFKLDCEKTLDLTHRQLGERRSDDLKTYSGPTSTMGLIVNEDLWAKLFESIFGQDRGYWLVAKDIFGKCRPQFAHSSEEENLKPYELLLFEGFCKHILSICDNYMCSPALTGDATTGVEEKDTNGEFIHDGNIETSPAPSFIDRAKQPTDAPTVYQGSVNWHSDRELYIILNNNTSTRITNNKDLEQGVADDKIVVPFTVIANEELTIHNFQNGQRVNFKVQDGMNKNSKKPRLEAYHIRKC